MGAFRLNGIGVYPKIAQLGQFLLAQLYELVVLGLHLYGL